MWNSKGGQ
jgi:hypothetical protein